MKVRAQTPAAGFEVEVRPRAEPDRFDVLIRDESGGTVELGVTVLSRHSGRWVLQTEQAIHDLILEEADGRIWVDDGAGRLPVEITSLKDRLRSAAGTPAADELISVKAQMPGRVVRVLKSAGDPVAAGEGVLVIEAMKMQNEIRAPRDGTVVACPLSSGQSVATGEILFEIE